MRCTPVGGGWTILWWNLTGDSLSLVLAQVSQFEIKHTLFYQKSPCFLNLLIRTDVETAE